MTRTAPLTRTTTLQRRSHTPEDQARLGVYRFVNARDEGSCRCCGRYAPLDGEGGATPGHPHHLLERSQGGEDTSENICVVCGRCHQRIHGAGAITVAGNADDTLTFTDTATGKTWSHSPGQEHPHAREAAHADAVA